MFNLFVSALKMQFSQQLPGKPAQQLLKPYLKISKALDAPVPYNAKKSAVMALLFPVDDQPHLLLIERNEYKGAHSGQLAFPGGKIEKGDTFYLFTDGYADQFGGEKNKKLTKAKFKETLLNMMHLNMYEQRNFLYDFHLNYKGDHEQVDDILILGVRV